jgi:hypothetical protein
MLSAPPARAQTALEIREVLGLPGTFYVTCTMERKVASAEKFAKSCSNRKEVINPTNI